MAWIMYCWFFLQWQRANGISLIYFAIRWSILVFFLTTWLVSLIQSEVNTDSNARWLIYLTNWGYTLCTTQSVLSVIMVTSALLTEKRKGAKEDYLTGKLYKLYWTINGMATVVAFGITILFWTLIYEGKRQDTANFRRQRILLREAKFHSRMRKWNSN